MQGYIKLYRKLREKGFYGRSSYVHLWVHLLLSASHKEKEFLWNNKIIKLKPGQFLTSRVEISKKTKIPQTTIEDILNLFENEHQIRQQKFTKFRVITIQNWKKYQGEKKSPTPARHQGLNIDPKNPDTKSDNKNSNNLNIKSNRNKDNPTPNPTTGRHQSDTINNDKNIKKREEILLSSKEKDVLKSIISLISFSYKPTERDSEALRTAVAEHGAKKVEEVLKWHIQGKRFAEYKSISSGLTETSFHLFEEAKRNSSWQEV